MTARNATISLLFQRTRWPDAWACARNPVICQIFSFARLLIPHRNHSADSKILHARTGNPGRGCHEPHSRIPGQGIRTLIPSRDRERCGAAGRHAPICANVDKFIGTDARSAVGKCIELGNSAIAMVLTAHIAGQFTPSAIPNCPFEIARARIAKTVIEK